MISYHKNLLCHIEIPALFWSAAIVKQNFCHCNLFSKSNNIFIKINVIKINIKIQKMFGIMKILQNLNQRIEHKIFLVALLNIFTVGNFCKNCYKSFELKSWWDHLNWSFRHIKGQSLVLGWWSSLISSHQEGIWYW